MMKYIAIWLGAASLYVSFWFWHSAPQDVLSRAEITEQLAVYTHLYQHGRDAEHRIQLRGFLAADDGSEVFTIHLVRMRVRPKPVEGVRIDQLSSFDMLRKYVDGLIWPLYLRAGYPLLVAPAASDNLGAWGAPPEGAPPGDAAEPVQWTHIAVIRHRSRRDLMALALNPEFAARYKFAVAAIETQIMFSAAPLNQLLMLKPPVVMAWIIFALAALAHIIAAFQGRRSQTSM